MNTNHTAQILTIPTPNPAQQRKNRMGGFWGTFGGLKNTQNPDYSSLNDSLGNHVDVRKKLISKLEQADLRNKKGKEQAHKLICGDNAIRLIHDAAQANNGNHDHYVDGLLALIEQYDCSAACSARAICNAAAREGLSANMLEKQLWPLLIKLGIVLKLSEKSSRWESAEQIGKQENPILRKARILFDVSDERLLLRKQQEKAADEARLLIIAKKQTALAQKRKQLALTAANAATEAARIAETLPEDQSTGAFVKNNLLPLVIVGLFAVVVIGGVLSGENTPGNSPTPENVQWSTLGNSGQQPVNPSQQPLTTQGQPLTTPATAYESVWSAPLEEKPQGEKQ